MRLFCLLINCTCSLPLYLLLSHCFWFKLLRSRNMLMDIHSRRTTSTRHVMAPPFYLLKIMLSKSVVFNEDRSEKLTRLYCELYEFWRNRGYHLIMSIENKFKNVNVKWLRMMKIKCMYRDNRIAMQLMKHRIWCFIAHLSSQYSIKWCFSIRWYFLYLTYA